MNVISGIKKIMNTKDNYILCYIKICNKDEYIVLH